MSASPRFHLLVAGQASAEFNPNTGAIGRVRVGGTEAVRGLYGAVRDADWGTPPPRLSNLQWTESTVTFDAVTVLPSGEFSWRGEVVLTPEALEFRFEGQGDVETNRAGLCLLLPPALAGSKCFVEHSDGSRDQGRFPLRISPHQPFFDIRSMTLQDGSRIETEGDVFEMEDQRNWTDASYKLYCRPLALPLPYRPTRVEQRIAIRFGEVVPSSASPLRIEIGPGRWPLPSLGTVGTEALGLPLGHLRSPDSEGGQVQTDLCTGSTFRIGPGGVPGTDSNFTELNRSRPDSSVPGVSFASNPQCHAFDDRTIMESMPMLGECVRTARTFFGGPIHVGPVTMRPRGGAEPRELEPMAAGWVFGGIAAVAEAAAASVTYLDAAMLAASPAAAVIRALDGREECLETVVSDPDQCSAIAFEDGTLLLANLTPGTLEVCGYVLAPYEFKVGRRG